MVNAEEVRQSVLDRTSGRKGSSVMKDALVPLDLLFGSPMPEELSDPVGSGVVGRGSTTLPLAALPMMPLIAGAMKGKGDRESYYRYCVASGFCRSSVDVRSFGREFRRHVRSLRWGFSSGKPVIAALENDCLIVQDGIDLCCIAKALGKSWLRVSLPEDVHAKWAARDTRELDEIVARTSRRVFYNPIDHPGYRKARVARRDSVRLDRIRALLGPLGPGLRGLDIGCNMGYTSHHLQRQGFRMTGVDFDEDHLAVAEALNTTYGLDVKFVHGYFRQFEADGPFDITVALTVLYHMFYRQEEQNMPEQARMDKTATLQKVDALTRHALLWESGPEPQREIDFIRSNSGLCDYCSLSRTQGTGKKRELGVFLRPGTDLSDYLKRRCTALFVG